MRTHPESSLLSHYRKLHDGLSDMIESGRLTEADIEDDYQWLVHMLERAVYLDDQAAQARLDGEG